MDAWRAGVAYYLDPLTHAGTEPLAETEFIERPRTIQVTFERVRTRMGLGGEQPRYRFTDTTTGIAYRHRSTRSPHALSAGYEYTDLDASLHPGSMPQPVILPDTGDAHGVRLGYDFYLQPRWTVGATGHYAYHQTENRDGATHLERFQVMVNSRYLVPLAGSQWLSISGQVGRAEMRTTIELDPWPDFHHSQGFTLLGTDVDFYFSRHTAVGAHWRFESLTDDHTFGLRMQHFWTERAAVDVGIDRTLEDNASDTTTIHGGMTFRF